MTNDSTITKSKMQLTVIFRPS